MHITNMDFKLLNLIYKHSSCNLLDAVMPKISASCNGGVVWIAIAAIMILSDTYKAAGFTLAIGLILSAIIVNLVLKNVIARPRPCWIDHSVPLLIKCPRDYSFPSGHTFSSFTAAAILICTNIQFGMAAFVLAVLIGFSRLYLYVHFPTDVIASVFMGIGAGILACFIYDNIIILYI